LLSEDGSDQLGFDFLGLDLFRVRRLLESCGASVGSYHYESSDKRRFTVLRAEEITPGVYSLVLAGKNLADYLPSVYQENRQLEQYLWIIQHLQYEQTAILDNLHEFFMPGLAPPEFLHWMADWFGMSRGFEFEEPVLRSILQKGIELYKWRGTARGLKMFLALTVGTEPEIKENIGWHDSHDQDVIRSRQNSSTPVICVHFPVPADHFTSAEKARIATICEQEKPANVEFFITFEKAHSQREKGIRISDQEALFK